MYSPYSTAEWRIKTSERRQFSYQTPSPLKKHLDPDQGCWTNIVVHQLEDSEKNAGPAPALRKIQAQCVDPDKAIFLKSKSGKTEEKKSDPGPDPTLIR